MQISQLSHLEVITAPKSLDLIWNGPVENSPEPSPALKFTLTSHLKEHFYLLWVRRTTWPVDTLTRDPRQHHKTSPDPITLNIVSTLLSSKGASGPVKTFRCHLAGFLAAFYWRVDDNGCCCFFLLLFFKRDRAKYCYTVCLYLRHYIKLLFLYILLALWQRIIFPNVVWSVPLSFESEWSRRLQGNSIQTLRLSGRLCRILHFIPHAGDFRRWELPSCSNEKDLLTSSL